MYPSRATFRFEEMNSKNCYELKTLAETLMKTYGEKESEDNWNKSASIIRKISNFLISDSGKEYSLNDEIFKLIIHVLEKTVQE